MARLSFLIIIVICASTAIADPGITTVDFLEGAGVEINAAGPVLVQMDEGRNRLVAANTLTSSISLIDCASRAVKNIALADRALQHLKAEAMSINRATGGIYLIGTRCVHIVDPEKGSARTVETDVQYESIAIDEATGNVYVAGRESATLGVIKPGSKKIKHIDWLEHKEQLINLNATPPPPIRKVFCDPALERVIAVDGFTSTLHLFDSKKIKHVSSRPLALTSGGRWHLGGYDTARHRLFVVVETDKRKVIEAISIDIVEDDDVVVALPEYTEGVGVIYNPKRGDVYIPYDNQASVHVAGFENGGTLDEILIPTFGNDASAINLERDLLYVASWAQGEVDVIDLKSRTLVKRIENLGIIPHMFTMAFNPANNRIYYSKGASAVNGTFGAAVTELDPETEETTKIRTGWAPIDLVEVPDRGEFFVFNSENQFAVVRPDGSYDVHDLPFDYPVCAALNNVGDIYLSYGPHQSYWPTVYIWGARNGILSIDPATLEFYDRRIPRQAQRMVIGGDGVAYFPQNNWGKEEQFIGTLEDGVRLFDINKRVHLVDEVQREITQRILEYDADLNRLYLVRIGETDDERGMLFIVDPVEKKVVERVPLGLTTTDLIFDNENIYAANFDSGNVSVIDKRTFASTELPTGEKPLKLRGVAGTVYAIDHNGHTLHEVREGGKHYRIPGKGYPDNLFAWRGKVVVTSHSADKLDVSLFDPESRSFDSLHKIEYPYGNTRFDTANVSFFVRGQYGDVVFEITRALIDKDDRLWITDFLSGKLFIIE